MAQAPARLSVETTIPGSGACGSGPPGVLAVAISPAAIRAMII